MSWYKKSQEQLELGLENPSVQLVQNKRIKSDPNSVEHILGVVAGMLFNDKISDETIRNIIKDLKSLKEKGIIKFQIGMSIYNKFDKACKYQGIVSEDIMDRKKMALDRLRRIMEDLA